MKLDNKYIHSNIKWDLFTKHLYFTNWKMFTG